MNPVEDLFISGMYFKRDGTPYRDSMEWAIDFEKTNRRVAEKNLWWGGYVSTVWLGLNHNHFGGGPPLIFETMVFSRLGRGDLEMRRYSTESEAKRGHDEVVREWQFPLFKLIRLWCSDLYWMIRRWTRKTR